MNRQPPHRTRHSRNWNSGFPVNACWKSCGKTKAALLAVALMGIAQRRVAVKYGQKSRGLKHINALETNVKTLGDWIKAKREAKNLTPSHLAARMGIAAAVVCSWECNTQLPSNQQLVDLSSLLEFNADEVKIRNW